MDTVHLRHETFWKWNKWFGVLIATQGYCQSLIKAPVTEYLEGTGYIADPQGQVEVVGISMFHQLHCLVGPDTSTSSGSNGSNPYSLWT